MPNPNDIPYDATRDARTGWPVLPIDAENTRKAKTESQPLTAEDNQGIAFDDEDTSAVGEEDDLPQESGTEDDESDAPSSVEVNSTVPRMRAPDPVDEEPQERVEGERPEALAKFAEVARNSDGKPVRNGVEATAETAPIPIDPAQKQDAATRVLREGALKEDQGADETVDKLPDRTAARHSFP